MNAFVATTVVASAETAENNPILNISIFAAFVAFYLGSSAKPFRIHVLPEDRLDGEIADADPELGFFPPQSWWPFVLALAVGLIFLGISIGGWWFAYFSAPLFIIALVGWVFEYYRGRYAH